MQCPATTILSVRCAAYWTWTQGAQARMHALEALQERQEQMRAAWQSLYIGACFMCCGQPKLDFKLALMRVAFGSDAHVVSEPDVVDIMQLHAMH